MMTESCSGVVCLILPLKETSSCRDEENLRSPGSGSLKQVFELKPPDHPGGLIDDVLRHFGNTDAPVDKDDRQFADAEPFAPRQETHFDLKRISVRAERIK